MIELQARVLSILRRLHTFLHQELELSNNSSQDDIETQIDSEARKTDEPVRNEVSIRLTL
jgi:hypothetical protein